MCTWCNHPFIRWPPIHIYLPSFQSFLVPALDLLFPLLTHARTYAHTCTRNTNTRAHTRPHTPPTPSIFSDLHLPVSLSSYSSSLPCLPPQKTVYGPKSAAAPPVERMEKCVCVCVWCGRVHECMYDILLRSPSNLCSCLHCPKS